MKIMLEDVAKPNEKNAKSSNEKLAFDFDQMVVKFGLNLHLSDTCGDGYAK